MSNNTERFIRRTKDKIGGPTMASLLVPSTGP